MSTNLRAQLAEAKAKVSQLKFLDRCKRAPVKGWIGGIIQAEREARGWSLHELSRQSGVSMGKVSTLEASDKSSPTLATIGKIAKAFGLPVSELVLRWEKEMLSPESKFKFGNR